MTEAKRISELGVAAALVALSTCKCYTKPHNVGTAVLWVCSDGSIVVLNSGVDCVYFSEPKYPDLLDFSEYQKAVA